MIKSINNMVKKLFRYLVRTLSALLICILIYFVYISIWVKNFNAEQRSAVENIDSEFIQTSPIIRDPVSIRPRACFFPLFSFLPLWLHYNLNPLCVQY